MRKGWNAKSIAAAALACIVLVVPVQRHIDSMRRRLVQENAIPAQLPLSSATSAALGGFRGIAVDILWMKADSMLNDSQFYQLMTYYEFISILQPNFPTVWSYNAWNLAYNISFEWSKPDEKWLWVKKGVDFAEKGLKYNPGSVSLLFDTGWYYFNKIGPDDYFSRRLYEETGREPYLMAYEYWSKAVAITLEEGDNDARLRGAAVQALFRQGLSVKRRSGNVPEALSYFNRAEEDARQLLVEFPDDLAVTKLLADIRQAKADITSSSGAGK